MIEALSNRIAIKMKELNPDETASIEVMSYALQGIIHNAITFMTAFIVGIFTGHFLDTLLAVGCFMGLRLVSGGFHFKSAVACFVFSASIFIAIPLLSIPSSMLILINSLSLVLVIIFSPSNINEHIRVSEKYFVVFKIMSILFVGCSYLFDSNVVVLSLFAQAITLVHYKKEVKSE